MSHFVGLCFGNYEDYLDNYYEGLDVEPYICYTKEEAIDEIKQNKAKNYEWASNHLGEEGYDQDELLKIIEKGLFISYEDAWEKIKEWGYEIDEDENLLSTYNPDSKWDWYSIGGRWSGYLPLKDFDEDGNFQYVDEATIGEVDWDQFRIEHAAPFCFTTICGEWCESATMGWWCSTSNEKEENAWKEEFWNYLNSLDKDTIVTAIDFHI